MRKVFEFFQDVIKSCNVFTAPVNLRYKLDPDYNTVTGGFVSIGLIILLVSVFYNSWMQVLNKEAISSSKEVIREFQPQYMDVNSDDFMFAIGISGLNLSDTAQKQYFSLKMKKYTITNSPTYSKVSTNFNLQPCTSHHWEQLGEDFTQTFERQKLSGYLCAPRNTTVDLAGKYTSQKFIYYRIEVSQCSSNCRSQAQIDAWITANSTFSFNFYYSNTLINPDQTEPLSTFFEDKDYTMFSTAMFTSTNIYVGKYIMQTDESIFPWIDTQVKEGFIVNREQKQSWNYMATPTQSYCKLYIRKSNMRLEISRTFRKIDDMLSYIGGLFGIIAVGFGFIMNYYSQCCFQLEMCQNIFDYHNKKSNKEKLNQNDADDSQMDKSQSQAFGGRNNKSDDTWQASQTSQPQKVIQPMQFGFLDFLIHLIYSPLSKICNLKWKRMQIYQESLQEMRHKLDVSQLLEKFSFYDRSLNALFDQNQLKLLYLQEKFNFEQVRQERQLLGMRKDIIANLFGLVAADILPQPDSPFQQKKTLKEIASKQSRKRLQTFMGKSVHVFDLLAKMGPKQPQGDSSQMNLPDDIKRALRKLDDKIEKGDLTSVRIYNGLQYELLEAFQKSKMKKTKHCVTNKKPLTKNIRVIEDSKKDSLKSKKDKTLIVNFRGQESASSIYNLGLH